MNGSGAGPWSGLLGESFGSDEMRAVFDDSALIRAWLRVEAALAMAEAEVGLIPRASAEEIARVADTLEVDRARFSTEFGLVGYPIVGLVHQLSEAAGSDGAFVHWGATTQDIMDTATALQIQAADVIVARDLRRVLDHLRRLAAAHRGTAMVGRTHGQVAVPVTFGYKLAVVIAELERHLVRLAQCRRRAQVVQLGGAAGTLASLGPPGVEVRARMAGILDLQEPTITWHTSRDAIAEFLFVLCLIATTLGKLAQEVALLQRTEIAELSEGHVPGRGASSTMPQKRNPILSEAIVGASTYLRHAVGAAMAAMLHDGERATGPWHTEWLVVPEICVLAHGVIERSDSLLGSLVVDVDRMAANLAASDGLIAAEAVMMRMAGRVGHEQSHRLVAAAAARAIDGGRRFLDCLAEDPAITEHLTVAELEQLIDPKRYLGLAERFTNDVLASGDPDGPSIDMDGGIR